MQKYTFEDVMENRKFDKYVNSLDRWPDGAIKLSSVIKLIVEVLTKIHGSDWFLEEKYVYNIGEIYTPIVESSFQDATWKDLLNFRIPKRITKCTYNVYGIFLRYTGIILPNYAISPSNNPSDTYKEMEQDPWLDPVSLSLDDKFRVLKAINYLANNGIEIAYQYLVHNLPFRYAIANRDMNIQFFRSKEFETPKDLNKIIVSSYKLELTQMKDLIKIYTKLYDNVRYYEVYGNII